RHEGMKARSPLDTESPDTASAESAASPAAPPAPGDGASSRRERASVPDASPQWVELAAGRALRTAGPPPILPARRPIQLEPARPHEAPEPAREQEAAAADAAPTRGYRAAHATVFTTVMAFFVSGAGMCVYVLVRH